jgi:hypothetical protein
MKCPIHIFSSVDQSQPMSDYEDCDENHLLLDTQYATDMSTTDSRDEILERQWDTPSGSIAGSSRIRPFASGQSQVQFVDRGRDNGSSDNRTLNDTSSGGQTGKSLAHAKQTNTTKGTMQHSVSESCKV